MVGNGLMAAQVPGLANSDRLPPTKIDFSQTKPGVTGPVTALNPPATLKPGTPFGRGAGPAIIGETIHQLLDSDPLNSSFKGTADEAVDRYNWLLQNAPENVVPALHFTPHEFEGGQGPKLETVVVPLLREQVEGACPLYGAVQTEANLAVQAAGKVSDYRSAADFGTRALTIMKENIIHNYSGRLIPEQSY
jgi:hypothetical protein